MPTVTLTREEARRFLLLKHGLLGERKFEGSAGIVAFVRQVGCVQYDPIDICGKNAELVLQSRVEGFSKQALYSLLYEERRLLDHFDKNMAIYPVEDWKYFSRVRNHYQNNGKSREQVDAAAEEIRAVIREKGFVCSKDLNFKDPVDWYWSSAPLSRVALETLYFRGDLVVHHKKGTIKYYALANEHLPGEVLNAPDPNETEHDHMKWLVLRRIGAVGFLWNRPSDAWLGINGMKAGHRNEIFEALIREKRVRELFVEGLKSPVYCLAEDREILECALGNGRFEPRLEFIAPLDNLLWDRRLIGELFGFEYKWEIYTPLAQRKYSYYVLPILFGERFVGRIEMINDKKNGELRIENIWYEKGVRPSACKAALNRGFERFAAFHSCRSIVHSR